MPAGGGDSRPEGSREAGLGVQARWTCHAEGVLGPAGSVSLDGQAVAGVSGEWPPAGWESVDVDGLYDALAEQGLEYGPAFQGLRAVWCRGDELFAEVALAEEQRQGGVEGFMVHPALLDAALHALGAGSEEGGVGPRVPFSWSGVSLRMVGASVLRVCLSRVGTDTVSLTVADERTRWCSVLTRLCCGRYLLSSCVAWVTLILVGCLGWSGSRLPGCLRFLGWLGSS